MAAPSSSSSPSSAAFAELDSHAIPFITVTDDGGSGGECKFEVNPGAVAYLSSLPAPVSVVAIAGLYRTGKSYLLNALMGRGAGFTVGPTVKACTKVRMDQILSPVAGCDCVCAIMHVRECRRGVRVCVRVPLFAWRGCICTVCVYGCAWRGVAWRGVLLHVSVSVCW